MKPSPTIIIIGPTATGKTGLSLELANLITPTYQKGVEIISADSRQVYAGLEIFSGAADPDQTTTVPHHYLSHIDPAQHVSMNDFRHDASDLIDQITARNHLPLVVGGSGFWVSALLWQDSYPEVSPNPGLRAELEQLPVTVLHDKLSVMDPARATTIDRYNPRRLIRAIEIATALGSVPPVVKTPNPNIDPLIIYLHAPKDLTDQKIAANVQTRIDQGLVAEAEALRDVLPAERFTELGLAYKHIHRLWAGEINLAEFAGLTTTEEIQYAKRQKTFFKKLLAELAQHTDWPQVSLDVSDPDYRDQAWGQVQEFLAKK